MPVTNGNLPTLNRKSFQFMTPAPVATAAGSFVISPQSGNFNISMFVSSATVHYLYHHDEDAWVQIASGALGGTFGAGACGEYHPWSINYTANGGSTTTVTVAAATHNMSAPAVGSVIEFISSGTNSGLRRTVTAINTSGGGTGNITLTLDSAVSTAVLTSHTFRLNTGRFYVMSAGTTAAGSFRVYDVLTNAWQASLSITGFPWTWGTDGRMVCAFNFGEVQATGTATAGGASTLTNSAKTWTVNQWTNYQVRISAGTGIGQIRTIASNTATVLTTSTAWTTAPDATSVYNIEANEDFLYVLGNNAVTMYRYSISANTWTTMAPTTARGGAPIAGMGAVAIGKSGETAWADESNIQDGRYIYSFRWGTSVLDRFDIAGGTSGAGAWQAVTYSNATETFATGSSYFVMGRYIFIRKDATNRFFKFSVRGNYLEPLTTNLFPDGAAVLGNKIWVKNYDSTANIQWVYALQNTGAILHRVMIF
jgi:hypothetical protein